MDETGSKGAAIHEVKAQAGRKAKRVEASTQLLPDAATCCQERRTGRIEIHTFKVGVARKNVKRRNEDCRDLKGPEWRDEKRRLSMQDGAGRCYGPRKCGRRWWRKARRRQNVCRARD